MRMCVRCCRRTRPPLSTPLMFLNAAVLPLMSMSWLFTLRRPPLPISSPLACANQIKCSMPILMEHPPLQGYHCWPWDHNTPIQTAPRGHQKWSVGFQRPLRRPKEHSIVMMSASAQSFDTNLQSLTRAAWFRGLLRKSKMRRYLQVLFIFVDVVQL